MPSASKPSRKDSRIESTYGHIVLNVYPRPYPCVREGKLVPFAPLSVTHPTDK